MHTTNTFVGLGGDIISTNKQIKKLSLLTNYSDSGDNISISNTRSLDRYLYESLQKDNERFKLLFDMESNLKLIWQFGYFSFFQSRHHATWIEIKATCRRFSTNQHFSTGRWIHCKKRSTKSVSTFQVILSSRSSVQHIK